MSNAEAIPAMNCQQLQARWNKIKSPVAGANPFRNIAAERALVRQTAARKRCSLS